MKLFTKLAVAIVSISLASVASAGTLAGTKWKTATGSTVQFYKSGSSVSGKIVALPSSKAGNKCTKCKGSNKNKPLKGLTIITGLQSAGNNVWNKGQVFKPDNGKTYVGQATLSANGNKLKLKGHIKNMSWLGKTQTWTKVK